MPAQMPPGPERMERRRQRQRSKNWTLFGVLLGIVVLIYIVAIVRMSGG